MVHSSCRFHNDKIRVAFDSAPTGRKSLAAAPPARFLLFGSGNPTQLNLRIGIDNRGIAKQKHLPFGFRKSCCFLEISRLRGRIFRAITEDSHRWRKGDSSRRPHLAIRVQFTASYFSIFLAFSCLYEGFHRLFRGFSCGFPAVFQCDFNFSRYLPNAENEPHSAWDVDF